MGKHVDLGTVMKVVICAAAGTGLVHSVAAARPASAPDSLARKALAEAPLIDGHNDLAIRLRERTGGEIEDFDFQHSTTAQGDVTACNGPTAGKRPLWQTDIHALRAGGVGGQFWSAYVPAYLAPQDAVRATLEQIDIIKRIAAANSADMALATDAQDIERARGAGKIASLIGAEGGHSIGGSLAVLRQLYALGVRYMTLTHSRTTDLADSATDSPKHDGLSPFGVRVVAEMNRLGMLVDLSHVSHATMSDALDVSAAPVIFSHSSAYAIVPHTRNVPDDILARLRANGGVVMVSLIPRATNEAVNQWAAAEAAETARLKSLYPGQDDRIGNDLERWCKGHPVPVTTLAQVADHIDHIKRVAGIEHIAIGSDLEGDRFRIVGMETAKGFQDLFAELARRGYRQDELELISRGNILRVLREAQQVGERLRAERGADEQPLSPL